MKTDFGSDRRNSLPLLPEKFHCGEKLHIIESALVLVNNTTISKKYKSNFPVIHIYDSLSKI